MKEIVLTGAMALSLITVACENHKSRYINEVCARGTFNYCESGMTPAREPFYQSRDGGKYCISETKFSPEELRQYNEEQKLAFDEFSKEHCLGYFSCSDK